MTKKRNWKKEYAAQKARGEHPGRMERQRARRAIDKKDTGTVNKISPRRKGKDVSHNKAISKGGTNKDGVKLESPSKNRARNYKKKGKKA
jgi:hypothetical protein